jgi:hypothetical protein
MRRFTSRRRTKVGTQWKLYCLAHNTEKFATKAMRTGGSSRACGSTAAKPH